MRHTWFNILVCCFSSVIAGCATSTPQSAPYTAAPEQSVYQKITSSVSDSATKLVGYFKSKPKTASKKDALRLSNPIGSPGADLLVSMARLHESKNETAKAELQYQRALEKSPEHLPALLGYAHMLDRMGRREKASDYYDKATKRYPQESRLWNDQGLCFAQRNMLMQAEQSLTKAVALQPKNILYRNNLATVLVESGKSELALQHLIAAHGSAKGHYNLASLLHRKGDSQAASYHFAKAAQADPTMKEAQHWSSKLRNPAQRPTTTRLPMVAEQQTTPNRYNTRVSYKKLVRLPGQETAAKPQNQSGLPY